MCSDLNLIACLVEVFCEAVRSCSNMFENKRLIESNLYNFELGNNFHLLVDSLVGNVSIFFGGTISQYVAYVFNRLSLLTNKQLWKN